MSSCRPERAHDLLAESDVAAPEGAAQNVDVSMQDGPLSLEHVWVKFKLENDIISAEDLPKLPIPEQDQLPMVALVAGPPMERA